MNVNTTMAWMLSMFLLGSILSVADTAAESPQVSAANVSHAVGDGRWNWTIFLKASPEVLDSIKCVTYTLHPTFPVPVVEVCNRGNPDFPFAHSANGWGVFEIRISVLFKDGSRRNFTHMLAFDHPEHCRVRTHNVAMQVRPGLWEWTVFIEGDEEQLSHVQCVEYTLHPTFPQPVRRICERGSGKQAFPLSASGWGTFQIAVRIMTKDGQICELKHDLCFEDCEDTDDERPD
jgi:transcription initiation factor IIF auxiliary subunit